DRTPLDHARRPRWRAVGDALDPRLARVLPAARCCRLRTVIALSGTRRDLRLGAQGVRPAAWIHLRLVRVGEQSLLLSLAAALRRRQRRGDAGGARGG